MLYFTIMTKKYPSNFLKICLQSLLFVLLLFPLRSFVNTSGTSAGSHIIFIEDQWDEALRQAKLQHKHIFVDAYASWCGPCKMLKASTFTDDKAAAFFNSNFINVSIDMEKGQGPALAVKWQLQAYPTLIIFDSAGKPVLGTVGFIKPNELIRFGKQALSK